jgi:abhydrolase domain-containing protein 6
MVLPRLGSTRLRLPDPRLVLAVGCAALLLGAGPAAAEAAPDAPACEAVPVSAVVAGGTVHASVFGRGPPVVLLHGLFAQKEQWHHLACLLAGHGRRVVVPDLPGFGQSTGFPLAVYRLDGQVARLDEFVDALGLREFDLAGNSMGGAIAARYALAHPRRVRSLAFIGAPLGVVGWGRDVRAAIEAGVNPFIPLDGGQLDIELALLFVSPPSVPDAARELLLREYNANLGHYTQVWNIVNLELDALRHGPRLAVPALAIWGVDDKVYPIGGAGPLRSRLPNGAFVPLGGAGHLPQVEQPGRVIAIYEPFLARAAALARASGNPRSCLSNRCDQPPPSEKAVEKHRASQ